jgi:hypothetical protein
MSACRVLVGRSQNSQRANAATAAVKVGVASMTIAKLDIEFMAAPSPTTA